MIIFFNKGKFVHLYRFGSQPFNKGTTGCFGCGKLICNFCGSESNKILTFALRKQPSREQRLI